MYDYIKGIVAELTPSYVVVENGGIGYLVNISLVTYEKIKGQKEIKIFVYEIVKEDAYDLYGFADTLERNVFRHLISISGIGANTARLVLSSLSAEKVIEAIANEDVSTLKSIKGIGIKTAQRIIVELKDKITSGKLSETIATAAHDSSIKQEAISALIMLGFNKKNSEEVVTKLLDKTPNLDIETLLKTAIRQMSS